MNEILSKFKNPVIGFLDESSFRLNPNRRRVINTATVRYRGGERRSKAIFGFMAFNGKDVAMVSDRSKAVDAKTFLELVRKDNPGRPICSVLDNAKIHRARVVKEGAEELGIHPIYLPPYSPDLNPIEFGWKDVKRKLSEILDFDEMVEKSRGVTLELFDERKAGYASHWMETFIGDRSS